MDLHEAIYQRRSIRQFSDTEVERGKIDILLRAAVQAPSAMNSQPWAFAYIKDAAILKEYSDRAKKYLLDSVDEFPVLAKYKPAFKNPDFNIFYNAASLVIIYAKPSHPGACADCSLAAQNLMLTAHSIGLGSCWIGFAQIFLNTPEVMSELNVPEGYTAVAPIIVGYPKKPAPDVAKNEPEILFEK